MEEERIILIARVREVERKKDSRREGRDRVKKERERV